MKLKPFFDRNEFERVIFHGESLDLSADRDASSLLLLSHLLVFRKEQRGSDLPAVSGNSSRLQGSSAGNDSQYAFLRKTAESIHSRFSNDSVINYLYAVILRERPEKGDSSFICELLIRAIKQASFNWSAWRELAECDDPISDETENFLKKQDLYPFYRIEKLRRLKKFKQVLSEISKSALRDWSYLDAIEGTCYHELRIFPAAALAFERIRKRDPFHVEGMDEYSNCLFVLEREQDLAQLASHV